MDDDDISDIEWDLAGAMDSLFNGSVPVCNGFSVYNEYGQKILERNEDGSMTKVMRNMN